MNAAVCSLCRQVHYAVNTEPYWGAINGIVEFMSPEFKRKWYTGKVKGQTTTPLPCLPLDTIMEKVGVRHVHFFSLDVEGAELEVLKGIDFTRFSFDVMAVEADETDLNIANGKDKEILEFLESKGYELHSNYGRSNWIVRTSRASVQKGTPWYVQTLETTGTASSDEPADCNLTRIEIPKWASGKAASVLDAKPSTVAALVSPARFRSQSKEDQYAFKTFFQGKPKGVFLEMGALDGHQFSNTYALEKDVGWRGVLIEPEPGLFLTLILSLTLIAHRP